jgi:hypothetical protein
VKSDIKIISEEGKRVVGQYADESFAYIEETMVAGVRRTRRVSFLERWRDTGKISRGEYAAAKQFEDDYELGMASPNYVLSDYGDRIDKSRTESQLGSLEIARLQAFTRTAQAMKKVGFRAAKVLVECVALSQPLSVFGKERIRAEGMLQSALCQLVDFYGV